MFAIIENNTAGVGGSTPDGGGIHIGGSNSDNYSSNISINNVIIRNNVAYHNGGGINIEGMSLVDINNCIIESNESTNNNGGGIAIRQASSDSPGPQVSIKDCIIRDNLSF